MLKAEREKYAIFISKLSEAAAKDFLLSEHEKLVDALAKLAQANALIENCNRLYTKLNQDYDTLKADYDKALAANKELIVLLQKEQDKEKLKIKAMYGMKSEKIDAIADLAESRFKEPVDESRNEENDADSPNKGKNTASGNKRSGLSVIKGKKKRNRKGETHESRLKSSMDEMPHLITYDFDSEEFDRKYGKWNWRIRGYKIHKVIKKINSPYYVEVIKTPVISVGLEHRLKTERYENPIIPKTHLSSSFMAEILYNKYCLSIPCYRMASYYKAHGLDISRQLIIGWINKCVPNLLGPVYDALKDEGRKADCNQVDETYFRVNKDGRKPGSKSFMWVHATGELTGGHPSIVFCFEKTRGTDHLRDYYREFSGYIISDAYISYDVLAEESKGRISSAKCMMHCRRNFAIAFFVYANESMSDDQLADLEETKALLLIRDIYQAEEPLRKLTPDERLQNTLTEKTEASCLI